MRSRSRKGTRVLFVMMMLIATACGSGSVTDPGAGNRVSVSLAKQGYWQGDTVVAVVTNVSGMTLEYSPGFCPVVLQRARGRPQDGDWITASPPPSGCTLALGYIGAGKSVQALYRLAGDLPPGTYRLTLPPPVPSYRDARSPEPLLVTPQFNVGAFAL